MKKTLFVSVLFLLSAALFSNEITLVADEWSPYNGNPDDKQPGYMIEIARAVFEKQGYRIVYRTIPWTRAIVEVRQGKYDGLVGPSKEETPDFVFPAKELGVSKPVFYTLKSSTWKYDGLSSLKNTSLGIIQDYSYGTFYDDYIKANEKNTKLIQMVSGDNALALNIKKLSGGRINVLLESSTVFEYFLFAEKIENIFKEAGSLEEEKLYIAFSPLNPKAKEYAGILSVGLDELRKSGKLKKILESYGLKDWQ